MVRLSAQAHFPSLVFRSERVWFEVPKRLEDQVNVSGDPWLAAFLPLAVTLRRPLILDLPVDARLLANCGQLMDWWSRWFAGLSPVLVEADTSQPSATQPSRRTAQFFSGGVDSFYTLLNTHQSGELDIEELLLVHGFDIPLDQQDGFDTTHYRLAHAIAPLGKPLIPIATNLRETRFQEVNWGDMGYGCLLAAAALSLAPRFRTVLISSGLHPGHFSPSATDPDLDPLFSTHMTEFIHYGSETSRVEKMTLLASIPSAFQHLRVCYHAYSGINCGRCLKCIFAMTLLEAMGKLEHCHAFPPGKLDLDLVRRMYVSRGETIFRLTQAYALKQGKADLAQAIEAAFQRTARIDRIWLLGWIRRFRARYRHHPGVRLATRRLRRWSYAIGDRLNRLVP